MAFQVLFQTEFAPAISVRSVFEVAADPHSQALEKEIFEQAQSLVNGVESKRSEIDSKIQSVSQHWKIERMASVDRNILRLAVYEMLFAPNPLKPAIAINEAVELAKKFGSQDSSSFVNGILGQLTKGLG
jgi:N utilization substance protein B